MGSRLTPSMGRFFEASKSDPGHVSSWECQLQQWGAKSLEKLNAEDRQTEVAKRQSGAIAAREAEQKAVSAGGELTFGPMIPADSALSASSNMVMIGCSPSQLLEYVRTVISAASEGVNDFNNFRVD